MLEGKADRSSSRDQVLSSSPNRIAQPPPPPRSLSRLRLNVEVCRVDIFPTIFFIGKNVSISIENFPATQKKNLSPAIDCCATLIQLETHDHTTFFS